MLLRTTVRSHVGGAKQGPGTVIPICLCNVPNGVSRVVSMTIGCSVPMVRSTTRKFNDAFSERVYNAFNACNILDFGKGGVVAADNNNTLVYSGRSTGGRVVFCTARTHRTCPCCRRRRVNCGCQVDGVYTNVNHNRVVITSRRVMRRGRIYYVCESLLGSVRNVVLRRGPSSHCSDGC